MGTIFLRSDSDKWGQGLKWGQSESGDNMLFLRILAPSIQVFTLCQNLMVSTPCITMYLESSIYKTAKL